MIIKVCGMRDAKNIRQVEQAGADWMGFIDYERSPRYVKGVPEYLPVSLQKVGVFVNTSLPHIQERIADWHLDFVQLHGKESPGFCQQLQATGIKVIKAFSLRTQKTCRQQKIIFHFVIISCSILPAKDMEVLERVLTGNC